MIKSLAQAPIDFLEEFRFIQEERNRRYPWKGAGILLPLFFSEEKPPGREGRGEFVFLFNKRSKKVPQGGDLCAPGGGIHPFFDPLAQTLLQFGIFPGARSAGFKEARQRGKKIFKIILLFCACAMRESWEEMHLNPFGVEFLGPLKTYRMQVRRRILFPVVGRVKRTGQYNPSKEVEKVIAIPLRAFFLPANYSIYALEVPPMLREEGLPHLWNFPSLVYKANGVEEILWGATFAVIHSFLRIVLGYPLPIPDGSRVIYRRLDLNYLSGDKITGI